MSTYRSFKFVSTLLLAIYIWNETEAYFTNFKIKRFEICNNTQRQIKYYGHITAEKEKQYLTHNVTIPFPLGDNIGGVCLIETKTIGNNFAELFTIREKHLCKGMNKYVGEFWYDIERESLMAPGVCPIQQGRYHGNHIELHFEKITLQTFPFGTLRFTIEAINNTNKNSLWCLLAEVDNIVN